MRPPYGLALQTRPFLRSHFTKDTTFMILLYKRDQFYSLIVQIKGTKLFTNMSRHILHMRVHKIFNVCFGFFGSAIY